MFRAFFRSLPDRNPAFAAALAVALLIVVVNEYTYRTATATLRGGIALTDQRIAAAQLLQALTDAETGQRGYLLMQDEADLAGYNKAVAVVPALREKVVPFIDAHNHLSAVEINEILNSRLDEMATTIQLAKNGAGPLALDILKAGSGSQWMSTFRQIMDTEMRGAALRQTAARISIYDALDVNRAGVLFLTLFSVLLLYLYFRQVKKNQQEKQAIHTQLEATIADRTLELRELAKYLQTIREAEKDHLARELHDQLGALLTVAKLSLAGLRKGLEAQPALLERVERVSSLLNEVIALKRRMVEDMRPSSLTMLGLRSALAQHCRELADAMGIPFHVEVDDISLAPESELAIFRFVQEALTNIVKYSNAKNVWVQLRNDATNYEIVVRDDGNGFDPNVALAGRHGLTGMRYRIDALGGEMTLNTLPGEGTRVQALIPKL